MGIILGITLAAIIAAWIWLSKTRGWDRKPTEDEIKEKIGEVWEWDK